MGRAIAVGVFRLLTEGVGGEGFLIRVGRAGIAGGLVRVLDGGERVVGVDLAAGARGHAVDVLRGLEDAVVDHGPHGEDVVVPVVGVVGDLVVGAVLRHAVDIVCDRPRGAAEQVVGSLGEQAAASVTWSLRPASS